MLDAIGSIIGGLLGGLLGDKSGAKAADRRLEAFSRGEAVRIPCALRYEGESWWRHGDLLLSASEAAWTPPKLSTGKIPLPSNKMSVLGVRRATLEEAMDINPGCDIVTCRLGSRKVELAVPRKDVAVLRGWLAGGQDEVGAGGPGVGAVA